MKLRETSAAREARRAAVREANADRPVYFKQDRGVRGLGHKVICISLPPAVLAVIDAAATELGMARSEYLRTAGLSMAAALKGNKP